MQKFKNLLGVEIASSALYNSGHVGCVSLGHLLREAKVTDLCIHIRVQKYVTALHITVYDSRITPVM